MKPFVTIANLTSTVILLTTFNPETDAAETIAFDTEHTVFSRSCKPESELEDMNARVNSWSKFFDVHKTQSGFMTDVLEWAPNNTTMFYNGGYYTINEQIEGDAIRQTIPTPEMVRLLLSFFKYAYEDGIDDVRTSLVKVAPRLRAFIEEYTEAGIASGLYKPVPQTSKK